MRLGPKLIAVAALPAVAASLGVGFFAALRQEAALEYALARRGETLARVFAEGAGEILIAGGGARARLDAALRALKEEEGLVAARVLDEDGELLAAREFRPATADFPKLIKRPILAPAPPGEIREAIGLVELALDRGPVERDINDVYRATLSAATLVGLLCALSAILLGRLITAPLRALAQATLRLGGGEYSAQVPVRGHDEIAAVGRLFNEMARALAERDLSLRQSRDALSAQAEELAALADRLRESLAARDALEAAKSALSDMIVHDLKNPLAGISGAAKLLAEGGGPDERPLAEGIATRANTMLGMIDDLLAIRRLEESRLPLLPTPFDLLELARESSANLGPVAAELGLSVEVSGVPKRVVADRQLISRVLENLLANALRYHKGQEPVRVSVAGGAGRVLVSVADRGEGVPPELRQAIFERFRQVLEPGASRRRGAGLGLTFCRMAVEAHGGRIWVEGAAGEGARFCFEIPESLPGVLGTDVAA